MTVKSLNNRADLLRWLRQYPDDKKNTYKSAELLGYKYVKAIKDEESNNTKIEDFLVSDGLKNKEEKPESNTDQRISQSYYYLSHIEHHATENEPVLPEVLQGVHSLTESDFKSLDKGSPILYQPITNEQRLSPIIRRKLRQKTGKHPDIPRLIRQLSEQKPLYTIPIKSRNLPVGRITVLLDLCDRLLPFWEDSYQVCELIKQKHGKFGQDIRVINGEKPRSDYIEYENWLEKKHDSVVWQPIPAQSIVFIISDLGQLSPKKSKIREYWINLLKRLNKRGIKPTVIAPIAREHQCSLVLSLSYQMLWHKHSFYLPQKLSHAQQEHKEKVIRVIAYLSISPHIEAVLLRAIINTVFNGETSGIEADVYLHPHIQWGYTCINVRLEHREYYQKRLSQEPARLQKKVLSLIKKHHIGQFPMVWFESVLNMEPYLNFPIEEIASIEVAENFMNRLAVTGIGDKQHEGLLGCMGRNLSRINLQQKQKYREGHSTIYYALTNQQSIKGGEEVPEEYDAGLVQRVIQESRVKQIYCVTQIAEQLYIEAKTTNNIGVIYGKTLAEFETAYDTVRIKKKLINLNGKQRILIPESYYQNKIMVLDTMQEKLTIKKMHKPTWATAISQLQQGLKAEMFFTGGHYELLFEHGYTGNRSIGTGETWLVHKGDDNIGFDEYGIYADLNYKNISQRFRWIEPNTFLMGSPEGEAGRYDDETQHQVTLTQGYWLADTAVTQEFWQRVMGENPSYFDTKQTDLNTTQNHPVEQVSRHDCLKFIEKLKQHFPEMDFRLPTEAEWENACRADSTTPFNFEGELDLDKVNYSGIFDKSGYANKALKRTAPVKSYPCNDWGLYEMHGNVWEWCKDYWNSDLGTEAVIDPETAKASSNRVLRGGSWSNDGRNVRSAIRNSYSPDYRGRSIGLRLALGQSSNSLLKQKSSRAISTSGRTGSSVKQETVSTDVEIESDLPTKQTWFDKLNPFK